MRKVFVYEGHTPGNIPGASRWRQRWHQHADTECRCSTEISHKPSLGEYVFQKQTSFTHLNKVCCSDEDKTLLQKAFLGSAEECR